MNFDHHPCFNAAAHRTFGRVHLPVAPRCNIQCKFCNRKFDCVNESRPGVTSGVLSPAQAMIYLDSVLERKSNIAVVGIAGPGDPFANPDETLETLRRTRDRHPEMMLCVATNGLNLVPYLDDLAAVGLSHVTITVNAVDPVIGQRIYSWVRYGKRVRRAREGAEILLENQMEAIRGLKARGMAVKVNTIIIPGVNDSHIEAVAKVVGGMSVDILNCVPYYPCSGSAFESLPEPSPEMVEEIRKKAGGHVKQMRHCKRCRADAVGRLDEAPDPELMDRLRACEKIVDAPAPPGGERPNIAVASLEGVLVNQHLGEAYQLMIFGPRNGEVVHLENRPTPEAGSGSDRWLELSDCLTDCRTLLVSGIGASPRKVLTAKGIEIFEIEGMIDEAVHSVYDGTPLNHLIRRKESPCGAGCSGTGGGCG